jgi:hypothetical protein
VRRASLVQVAGEHGVKLSQGRDLVEIAIATESCDGSSRREDGVQQDHQHHRVDLRRRSEPDSGVSWVSTVPEAASNSSGPHIQLLGHQEAAQVIRARDACPLRLGWK